MKRAILITAEVLSVGMRVKRFQVRGTGLSHLIVNDTGFSILWPGSGTLARRATRGCREDGGVRYTVDLPLDN